MGYRSTFISESVNMSDLPEWLKNKYENVLFFTDTIIATKKEIKIYDDEIFKDIQKAISQLDNLGRHTLSIVVMGEDQSISKVLISKEIITYIRFDNDTSYKSEFIWIM